MNGSPGDSDVTTCYRHNTQRAGVICQRCDRPICAQCMHQASVGFHCPECVKGGKQRVYRGAPTFDPIASKVLIALNVAAFVWSTIQSGTPSRISSEALRDGGLFATAFDPSVPELIGVAEGEWYRLISSGFLHDGMIHIAFNMYALWIIGPQLERVLGRPRFVSLYFVSMLGGGAGVMLLDPDIATVGASGAVFGMFGAIAVIQRASGLSIWKSGIGQLLVLNLFLTFAISSISVGGHVGGLVAGVMVAWADTTLERAGQPEWVGVAVTLALGAAFAVAAIVLASQPIL